MPMPRGRWEVQAGHPSAECWGGGWVGTVSPPPPPPPLPPLLVLPLSLLIPTNAKIFKCGIFKSNQRSKAVLPPLKFNLIHLPALWCI